MNYLIIPDVHGRLFWREPCRKYVEDPHWHIIFLGDYLDSYDFENISNTDVIANFAEIIELKQFHPESVTLLLGNHDLHYLPLFINDWGCRRIDRFKYEISKMFTNNIDSFDIAYECSQKTKKYLFTHAGVLSGWFDVIQQRTPCELSASGLNALKDSDAGLTELFRISRLRGGYDDYGSCLWADVHEHMYDIFDKNEELDKYYQIFGHTLGYPTLDTYEVNNKFAMLDCRKAFVLSNNQIIEYEKWED